MDNNIYKVDLTKATKEKTYYSLAMFPYPSGAGLHVGHGTNFTANDVVARFKRMQGYTVINPIGWDSFGLPTENYAMKLGRSASEVTAENIANYKKQCELMDWSYDWDREVTTSSPEYYKWTQWIFQQLFKAGLVYKKDAFVNRCPSCQTVLANDQVVDGRCERCDTEIIQKKHPQRFIKITDYAERLINDLDLVDRPEETKTQQKYWIGKSEGAEIDFAVDTGATTKKHYVVLHGYEGNIHANWLPRLAKNLQQAGHTVDLVELPNSAAPIVADQVKYVLDTCTFDENTIVIGHSLGCTVALKALEKISTTIEKCILVAGFLTWEVMQDPSDPDYAEEKKFFDHVNATFDRQYDLQTAKQHCKNFVVLHDKNDYAVQLSRAEDLAQKLDTTPVIFEATENHVCGKEEPVILEYALGKPEKITVFTTRPDTLFGVTALVLAPENASIDAYIPAEYKQALIDYRLATSKKTNIERQADAETKSGVFSGVYAIHPLTQEKVPVRFADYVLPDYATGAVMFVPAHDERDWAFAQKHGLEVKQVIMTDQEISEKCFTGNGTLINSAQFDGLDNQEAKKSITQYLEEQGLGKAKITYKLRDWSVSRQRYWGSPIPVYYDEAGNPQLIPEDQLPVVLPLDLGDYKPAGKSPLADHPTFPHYHAPDGKVYLRECDTLDTFMCSSFYYLRFIDPANTKELISKEFADKALPVDFYIGGKEHTYGHLLYSRFIHKFLFDQGVVPSAEPFQKLFHQGMVLGPDGRKMSKRRGNVITPGDLVEKYGTDMGADVLRTYTMFMGPLEVEKAWNDNAVDGVKRFLDRVARVMDFVGKGEASNPSNDKNSITFQTTIQLHKTIKGVTEDIEKLKFNTAISKLMVFVNHIYDVKQITKEHFATFLQLLAPFATKLTQKLWTELGQKGSIHTSIWPIYDELYLAEDSMDLPVQINGKMRGTLHIKKGLSQDEVFILVQNDEKLAVHLGDIVANPPKKIIFVQDKIINIIL